LLNSLHYYVYTTLNYVNFDKMPRAMRKKILIIEDDKTLSTVIQKNLSKMGYETYAAFDEEGGYNRSTQDKFALIICDIALPDKDKLNPKSGFKIVDKIREFDMEIPIIMITDKYNKR